MSHGATNTGSMAFSSTSRSCNNMTSTTDKKSTNGTLNKVNPWGSSGIWGSTNGLTPSTTARDITMSRDNAQADEFEGKTGSGSLVDSSVSEDWVNRNAWGAKRKNTLGRSMQAKGRFADNSLQQQRSASTANPASMSFPNQNQLPYTSRAPTISLNSTTIPTSRQSFSNTFGNGVNGRAEDPPQIYTKFNRAEPARTKPDSAVGGWADQSTPSPIDERRAQFPFHRTTSGPTSRDNSLPPSRHYDVEPPSFSRVDYSRQAQQPTPNSSRAPSISSQRNGGYSMYVNGGDQLASQFGQMSMNGDSRPGTSYRPMTASNGYNNYTTSTMSRPSWQAANGSMGRLQDLDDYDCTNLSFLGVEDATQRPNDYLSNYANPALAERYLQGSAYDFRPGQPYTGKGISPRPYEQQGAPRGSDWQHSANGSLAVSRRTPVVPDQQAYLDPRTRQLMAAELQVHSPYAAAMYDQYAFQNAMQYTGVPPYVNMMPMGVPGIDVSNGARDDLAGDGVQSALMYEFKSNTKTKRYELRDIYDHIAEFSGDQHGSRFIQTKLETANSDEKERIFREIEPNAIPLMTDIFGNYVIQKFFEHGDMSHKKILAKKMQGQVYTLSKQMYGCRVVQKALDHVLVDQQAQLVAELEGHVLECVKDQNGNHVIQKAIERCHSNTISFIIKAFSGQVQSLSIHAYGCRVIQRCLEKCDLPQKAMIMAELMQSIHTMISDQFGNYVVQHIVAHDEGECRKRVLDIVMNNLEGYSKHKFASNVVEKCLEKSDEQWRHQVVVRLVNNSQRRIEGENPIVLMIKDNFGNYVIQKLLDTLNAQDYFMFYDVVQPAVAHAKRTGCGKQILAIDKRMHKFDSMRNGSVGSATGGANINAPYNSRSAFPMNNYPSAFASNYTSAANTPPPLIADTPQSSLVPSINGDAVEGTINKSRQGSEQSNDHTGGIHR